MSKDNINKSNPGQFDFILFITVLIMLGFGLIMVLSASSPSALSEGRGSYHYVLIQAISAVIGIVLMFIISKINYKIWGKLYKPIYLGSILILLVVLVPGVGYSAGGATRWINLKVTTFQPSELVKIGIIIFYARYLTEHKNTIGTFVKGFLAPFIWLIPIILILVFVQSHLSAAIIMILLVVILMLMAGTKLRYFFSAGLVGLGLGGAGLYLLAKVYDIGAYRLKRVTAFLDPWADPTNERMADNTKFVCNRFRRLVWSRIRK